MSTCSQQLELNRSEHDLPRDLYPEASQYPTPEEWSLTVFSSAAVAYRTTSGVALLIDGVRKTLILALRQRSCREIGKKMPLRCAKFVVERLRNVCSHGMARQYLILESRPLS